MTAALEVPARESTEKPREAAEFLSGMDGRARVLVAGIGNIRMGDDGFGPEVAQSLVRRRQPPGVRVIDAGVRGFDLAFAMLNAPDHIILIDAHRHSTKPGTVFVIEVDIEDDFTARPESGDRVEPLADGHSIDPFSVLRLAWILGARPRHVMVVGCEPLTFGPEEGHEGLSDVVARSVPTAIALVETLISQVAGSCGTWHS
jgi:hydrogenase maturation protease